MALAATSSMSRASAQNDSPAPSTSTVRMHNIAFDPQSVTVKAGQTVVFENDDSVAHNVTGSDIGSSGDIAGGKTWKYTFTKPGDYHYVCTYHPGMTGEIVVTSGQ